MFFKSLPVYKLDLVIDNQNLSYQTCLVFIGNNETDTSFLEFGTHKYLSTGLLSISILKCSSRWQLFKCVMSIIFKNYKHSKYIMTFNSDNLVINSKRDNINIVIDGELFTLSNPLYFKVHKKSLKVIIP